MDFIGREALLRQKAEGVRRLYVHFTVQEHVPDTDPWAWGHEPILRDGAYCGLVTTSAFGYSLGKLVSATGDWAGAVRVGNGREWGPTARESGSGDLQQGGEGENGPDGGSAPGEIRPMCEMGTRCQGGQTRVVEKRATNLVSHVTEGGNCMDSDPESCS